MISTAVLAAFLLLTGSLMLTAMAQCSNEYRALDPQHTMCLADKGKNIPLSASDISAIVERHNYYRRQVSPTAANMQKMVWDKNLAKTAAKWARQCVVAHEDPEERRWEPALPGVQIGQNVAAGPSSVAAAVDNWATEIKAFYYGRQPTGEVGHYTQIIYAETSRVGCGMADCSRVPGAVFSKYQVCNYATSQLSHNAYTAPFTRSTSSCSDCKAKCDSTGKLCDCAGKVCFNGGTLAVATCTCTCAMGYTGNLCQTKKCPGRDTSQCQLYMEESSRRNKDACIYDNVQKEICPYRCRFCP